MTLENSKRLYEHYSKNGKIKEAQELAKKHPSLVEKPVQEKKEKKKKEKD